jgi:4-hydroxy-tetrahydrodipicolinate synthase
MPDTRLAGVFAAIATPITIDGRPDLDRFARHARWLIANGCDGLNVLGTTGEANSLAPARRREVMGAAAAAVEPGRMMVGTGTPDLETTIELTLHACRLGFAGALILPPYYYKGVSDDGLFAWFSQVVDKTASAPIPIYLYNFPQMTGITFSFELVSRLARAFPARIVGAKDSSGDLAYAARLAGIEGFSVFPSDESALARAGRDGFAGCISATTNVTAALSARLWRKQDDRMLEDEVRLARRTIASVPLISSVKYLLSRIHGDAEFERVLPPHLPLSAEQKAKLSGLALPASPALTGETA